MENDSPPPSNEPASEETGSGESDALTSIYDSGAPVEEGDLDGKERELGGRMTFLEHLDELRKRIMHALIALVVTSAAGWFFREQILDILQAPLPDDPEITLVYTKVTDAFTVWLKVSVAFGIFLASPFILLQVWLFISPGLYRREKKYSIPFLVSGTALFVAGGLFAYYIILPFSLRFLIQDLGASLQPMLTAVDYFSFVVIIVVGMGAVFQLPVLVAFLSLFGLITPRFLWKNFRYAVLLIFIIAAIVSPTPDALNLSFWAGPMILLYLGSIAVSWVFQRSRLRAEARERE